MTAQHWYKYYNSDVAGKGRDKSRPQSIFIFHYPFHRCVLPPMQPINPPAPSNNPLSNISNTHRMPRTPSLFSIRRTTTIVLVNSNFTMIQGAFRHMDRSTTITNRDAFNIESNITEQQLPPTASLIVGNDGKVIFWVLKDLEH